MLSTNGEIGVTLRYSGRVLALCVLVLLQVAPVKSQSGSSPVVAVVGYPELARASVEAELRKAGCCRVISLKDRARVLDEKALSRSGLADDTQAARAGRLLTANRIVVLEEAEGRVALRMVDVETGRLMVAYAPATPAALAANLVASVEAAPMREALKAIDLAKGKISCDLTLSRKEYRVGEFVKGAVECDADGYVTLFYYTAGGELQVLLPTGASGLSKIKKGDSVAFPEGLFSTSEVQLEVSEPYGADYLLLLVTREPVDFRAVLEGRSEMRGAQAASGARGVVVRVSGLKPGTWGGARACYETYRERPKALCREG